MLCRRFFKIYKSIYLFLQYKVSKSTFIYFTDFAQEIFTQDFWTPCIKLYFDMSRLIN